MKITEMIDAIKLVFMPF